MAAGLDYPGQKGIKIKQIDTHSLQGGDANALALAGYGDTQIQKMGQWKGATFKDYIWDKLESCTSGMSNAMKQKFNYITIASGAFADVGDITDATVQQEYATIEYNTL